jgi:uncharacterized protein
VGLCADRTVRRGARLAGLAAGRDLWVDNPAMGKVLVLVALVVAAVWLLRRALRAPKKGEFAQKPPVDGELVSCARCGVHLPRAEARMQSERLYCSEEHARLGPGNS